MAGTVTTEHYTLGSIRKFQFSIVADASDGSIPSVTLPPIEGRLLSLTTNPGSPAPSDNYDVVLRDDAGIDQLQGLGANRDEANSAETLLVYSGTSLHPYVDDADALVLSVSGNSVNSAVVDISLTYALGVR